MRQICLDTETTGLRVDAGDRLVQLGCFEIIDRVIKDGDGHFFSADINPEREVPAEAAAIHGLTTEYLADKPTFAAIADDFLAFVAGAELIIHNAEFDVGFLNAELARCGRGPLSDHCPKVIDSLALAKNIFPGSRNTLDALCDRFGVDRAARTRHGAALDARLLAEVYLAMTRNQGTLLAADARARETDPVGALPEASALVAALCPAQDAAAHREFLAMMDRRSPGGASLWTRRMRQLAS